MPTPMVVATLPFPAAEARKKPSSRSGVPTQVDDGAPAILPFAVGPARRESVAVRGATYDDLLDEASDLARRLGCQVRRRLLGGAGGGYRWVRGQMQIVLDVEADAANRLAVVADALRGEPRLVWAEMSSDLAAYLQPRHAA